MWILSRLWRKKRAAFIAALIGLVTKESQLRISDFDLRYPYEIPSIKS
ncbi:MAG: hypothetical protein ACJZ8C_00040 [Prochlorococcus marinus subsp. pastoris]